MANIRERYRYLVVGLLYTIVSCASIIIPVQRANAEETPEETPTNLVTIDESYDQTATSGDATVSNEQMVTEPTASGEQPEEISSEEVTPIYGIDDVENSVTPNPESQVDASIDNNVSQNAQSGDATIEAASQAVAQSGDVQSVATIINILNSLQGSQDDESFYLYLQDIFGDSIGDILLDIEAQTKGESPTCSICNYSSLASNSSINNNIDMTAQSGSATVSEADNGGEATSGNALTLLNLVNIINTSFSSGQNFVGLTNIYGDLNGDILLPSSLMEMLSANSSVTGSGPNVAIQSNQAISNQVTVSAVSGDAGVYASNGGTAASGNATTEIHTINFANMQIIGNSAFMIFVNVFGTWEGSIVGSAPGVSYATIGADTVDSTCTLCAYGYPHLTSTATITNHINLSAQSGDATVTNSGGGSSATTGNATAIVNMVNILNTNVNLDKWFGMFFINVFGSWTGSFGVDTPAGSPILPPTESDDVELPAVDIIATSQPQQLGSRTKKSSKFVSVTKNTLASDVDGEQDENSATLGSSLTPDAVVTPTAVQGMSYGYILIVSIILCAVAYEVYRYRHGSGA